jgi:hypothetical protein
VLLDLLDQLWRSGAVFQKGLFLKRFCCASERTARSKSTIDWMFDVASARKRLRRAYPKPTPAKAAEAA